MKFTSFKIVGIALALSVSAYACNCGCKDQGKDHKHKTDATTETVKTKASAGEAIVITGNDTMQFDKTAIEIKAGEPIKIVFKNGGNLPKVAMGHNLVILKPGTDPIAFGGAAASAKDTEYIPQDEANKALVVANTKVLGPGEEDTIEVTLEAGEYPFVCSFPGHAAIMKGVITAK